MSVLIFAAEGDAALDNAQAVSRWTRERLSAEGRAVRVLEGTEATREALEAALPAAEGLCAFTHGRVDAILDGERRPVLDHRNLHLLRDRWAWLFACLAGTELAGASAHAGAACVVGFVASVIVEWEEADLPPGLAEDFRRLTTEVPSALAAGERDSHRLLAALVPLVDAVLDFYADHPTPPAGFDITAQQLLNRLVVYP